MSEYKVIGYAAALRRDRFFAHGDAMLLAEDENILRSCIESTCKSKSAVSRYKTIKIRYGVAVSFDEITGNRFAEQAIEDGGEAQIQQFPSGTQRKNIQRARDPGQTQIIVAACASP